MSSLLQHDGEINRRGVWIKATRVHYGVMPGEGYHRTHDAELYVKPCTICGKHHAALYKFPRKPCGMFGCWVQFRINGSVQVPDLSVPMSFDGTCKAQQIPRDAVMLDVEAASKFWHS